MADNRMTSRRQSVRIAYCGMAAALSAALMLLGGVIPAATYAVPMLCGLLLLPVMLEFDAKAAWTTYAAAALIGRKLGHHRFFNGKSLEGSLSFLLTGWIIAAGFCFAGGLPGATLAVWLFGVFVSCIAEFFNEQIHLDDNFTIPLLFGAVAQWLPRLFS